MKAIFSLMFLVLATLMVESFGGILECDNGGTPHCKCDLGWCGKDCEYACNICPTKDGVQDGVPPTPNQILYDNVWVDVDYCVHGKCIYTKAHGPTCDCTGIPWEGDHCHTPKGDEISHRCIGYETDYTNANKHNASIVQHTCDLKIERCIPDNMDCMFNVPIKHVNGVPVCGNADGCKCKYPLGWCILLEEGNHVIKSMATNLHQYVDPFFFGQS